MERTGKVTLAYTKVMYQCKKRTTKNQKGHKCLSLHYYLTKTNIYSKNIFAIKETYHENNHYRQRICGTHRLHHFPCTTIIHPLAKKSRKAPALYGHKRRGLGLINTTQRLKLLYGNEARFAISNENDNFVLTEITIPHLRYP